MLNLQNRIKGIDRDREYLGQRITIRDKLLAKESNELKERMKELPHCQLTYPNINNLSEMSLKVIPQSGFYRGGTFEFQIIVPPEYNNMPPIVKCLTKIWHPNITVDGAICLSLLRQNTLDGFGWMPTRRLSDVIHGLQNLFDQLIDFDDPLNVEAAKQYNQSQDAFTAKVQEYIKKYAKT